jgi:O-acetyl-ADP-ribose deacetylase (regulator of RNase III)
LATFVDLTGNIFSSSAKAIVITVNCEGVMGAGIALDAKNRWPEIYDVYSKRCERNGFHVGEIMWAESESKKVALFPSKKLWRAPSKLSYISDGLDTLRTDIDQMSITSIALPHLGCSNGGLTWSEVKPLIVEKLSTIDGLLVELWKFEQNFVDQDFQEFRQVFLSLNPKDASSWVSFSKSTEKFIRQVLSERKLTNFVQLAEVRGVGKKTLEKIYKAALSDDFPIIQGSLNFDGSSK